jgi:hypothetical protein
MLLKSTPPPVLVVGVPSKLNVKTFVAAPPGVSGTVAVNSDHWPALV